MVNFWYTFLVFKKVTLAGLNSLRQKVYRISVKIWIFDELFHKRGTVLVILVPGMFQPPQSVMLLMKCGCKSYWGHGGCWGCGGHWGCRGSKVWKISTEDFRVILVIEFSFILTFWKKYWFGRFMKYHIEIYHLFCRRLLRPADVNFLKTGGWN